MPTYKLLFLLINKSSEKASHALI